MLLSRSLRSVICANHPPTTFKIKRQISSACRPRFIKPIACVHQFQDVFLIADAHSSDEGIFFSGLTAVAFIIQVGLSAFFSIFLLDTLVKGVQKVFAEREAKEKRLRVHALQESVGERLGIILVAILICVVYISVRIS